MSGALERYEPVIGIEVHVHLKTASKVFCRCAVRYGEAPNHQVCPVCLGLPGALPVLNRHAVELAVRAGLALGGKVNPRSVFARKNYFYPDLPKGYQISQYEEPLVTGGAVEIALEEDEPRRIGLTRIHMEEDAGKSVHGEWEQKNESHMDLNRAGVPLVEIVSEPEMHSSAEAGAYLRALREILRWVDVTGGDMEKGQLRADVNLSLRPRGSTALGTRTETKNLNSFRFVEECIEAEIERQAEVLDRGDPVVQATMLFDSARGTTQVMRVKENADDYRYFPDPDLTVLEIDAARIDEIRDRLPELPGPRRRRFTEAHGLSDYDARVLTATRPLADFFEATVERYGSAKAVANWMARDVLGALHEHALAIEASQLTPASLARLIELVDEDRVTPQNARSVLGTLLLEGGEPEARVREAGLEAVSDDAALGEAVEAVLASHPEMVARFREGQTKVMNFLMGQVMKHTQGKAAPGRVREILSRKLQE